MNPQLALLQSLETIANAVEGPRVKIFVCALGAHDEGPCPAIMEAASAIVEMCTDHRTSSPMIIVGLLPWQSLASSLPAGSLAMTSWPGFAYVPYGFGAAEWTAIVARARSGCRQPIPEGTRAGSTRDLLRICGEVRHWLENRLRNNAAAILDFNRVHAGEATLHPAYLSPVAAIAADHEAMLARLWTAVALGTYGQYEVEVIRGARTAILSFADSWEGIEKSRAALREHTNPERLRDMVRQLEAAHKDLEAAIHALQQLEAALDACH